MSENPGTLELIARHLILAVKPLRDAVSDQERFRQLMYRLGWNATALPPEYANLATVIDEALQALENLADEPTVEEVLDLLKEAKDVYDAIQNISIAPPGVNADAFLAEIGERLFELLLTDYLLAVQPAAYNLLAALNVVEVENVAPSEAQHAFIRTHFKWGEIPEIIRDPLALPQRVYVGAAPGRTHLRPQLPRCYPRGTRGHRPRLQ